MKREKFYGLLGRNGAGKTTLFNCLSGELKMDEGVASLEENANSRELREEDVGFVYSLPILPEFLTGYEFLRFFTDINRDVSQTDPKSIDDYFDLLSMSEEDRHRLIKDYSHGIVVGGASGFCLFTRAPSNIFTMIVFMLTLGYVVNCLESHS